MMPTQTKNAGPAKRPPYGSLLNGVARAAARGVPVLGAWPDDLNAATAALLEPLTPEAFDKAQGVEQGATFRERFGKQLAREHAQDRAFDADYPNLSSALQGVGTVAGLAAETMVAPRTLPLALGAVGGRILRRLPAKATGAATALATGKTIVPRMARGFGSGLVLGGAEGFGDDEGGRLANAGNAALLGGAWDGATPLVAQRARWAIGEYMRNPTLAKRTGKALEGLLPLADPVETLQGIVPLPFGGGEPRAHRN